MKEKGNKTNEISDLWGIIALLKKVIISAFVTIIIIVALFVLYLLRCNEAITTVDATGVYNLVNSETGDVIATDLTKEDINTLMEIISNGEVNGKN